MTSQHPLLSARLDALVERLSAYSLLTTTTLALEAAAAILAAEESPLQKKYREFFDAMLKKYGVSSPTELSDEQKSKFFEECGDGWKAGEGATEKAKKELSLSARRANLQAKLSAMAAERLANPSNPSTPPIYDEVFYDGVAALDAAAANDRDNAVVVTIPMPEKYAKRFPDPVMANHGHAPHLTLLFVGSKEYEPGEMSQILSVVRAVARKMPPFRLYVDPNAGLQDFGPNAEKGEKALWLPARSEPRGELERLSRMVRMGLEQEGIEVGAHDSFKPHVTWSYVPNDHPEQERNRMNAAVADRFKDGFYFDVRQILLSTPGGSPKVVALNPLPRKK